MSVLFTLLLLEAIFRVTGLGDPLEPDDLRLSWEPASGFLRHEDPEIRVVLRPSFTGAMIYRRVTDGEVVRRAAVHTTSRGLRGSQEVPDRPPPGRARILCLGDSVTFGLGVSDKDAFPAQLQRQLQRSGTAAEVLNAGVPSWGLDQELNWLRGPGLKLHPGVVLLAFFANDLMRPTPLALPPGRQHPDPARVMGSLEKPAPIWATVEGCLRRRWHLLNFLWRRWNLWRSMREAGQADLAGSQDYLDVLRRLSLDQGRMGLLAGSFRTLATTCRAQGMRCVVALIPLLESIHFDSMSDVLGRVAREARAAGLEVLDLTPALQSLPLAELIALPGEPHPSALAHRLMAREIARWLQARPGWLAAARQLAR